MKAVHGCTKTLAFQTSLPFEACGGSGVPHGTKPERLVELAKAWERYSCKVAPLRCKPRVQNVVVLGKL
ncbi:hypothetical protein IEQ34_009117 [Dendrobium chrysotoxum]|uniref:Uncharacterized protein n=1 Tax=Dendrobium chrysotoxum TaxID=161865 RepID=A0AAV7GZP3_DENCH|nr:hypothetical protein IEQ34_009117 [Dendrobium chrysotoxum]